MLGWTRGREVEKYEDDVADDAEGVEEVAKGVELRHDADDDDDDSVVGCTGRSGGSVGGCNAPLPFSLLPTANSPLPPSSHNPSAPPCLSAPSSCRNSSKPRLSGSPGGKIDDVGARCWLMAEGGVGWSKREEHAVDLGEPYEREGEVDVVGETEKGG